MSVENIYKGANTNKQKWKYEGGRLLKDRMSK